MYIDHSRSGSNATDLESVSTTVNGSRKSSIGSNNTASSGASRRYICMCMYIYVYVCMFVCMCICICTYIYI
jgi:hypothetical protein